MASTPQRCLWGPWSGIGLKVALTTLVLDQAHKWWMLLAYNIEAKGRVTITPFLDFVFVKNTGISYSLFDMATYTWQIVLAVFAAIAALALWIWLAT